MVFKPLSLDYLEWAAGQLAGDEVLVEFRHRSWLDEDNRAETLAFLEQRGLTYVIVDAPKTEARNLVPTVVARTSPTAYVRFHGRNAATWNKRTGSAAERFDYLYSEQELEEWVPPLRELATDAESVFALFNNNGRSQMPSTGLEGLDPEEVAGDPAKGEVAQAPANALMLRRACRRPASRSPDATAAPCRSAARDGRIPRPLRGLALFGVAPVPGPLDEVALLTAGFVLWLFYRPLLRDAWSASGS